MKASLQILTINDLTVGLRGSKAVHQLIWDFKLIASELERNVRAADSAHIRFEQVVRP